MESKTQNAFNNNVEKLTTTPENPKKSYTKWIKECWYYHSQHINEIDVAPDWGEWETDWNMCWCCGQRTSRLQRCHIVPKSLGGTFEPHNIVPLCGACHDEAPDVIDKNVMFEWIKEQQNPVTGLGLGRYWHLYDTLVEGLTQLHLKYGKIDEDELKELIAENYENTGVHGAQTKSRGLYWKNSTREWIMKRSIKDYEINREVDDWEEELDLDKSKIYKDNP